MTVRSTVFPSPGPSGPRLHSQPYAAFLAATSLTFLKPRFKHTLRPLVEQLARSGITANQVTVISLLGSLVIGAVLSIFGDQTILFGLLPGWLLARMGLATIDGTLAMDFGQKSRLGGILNEMGDILSDIALFLPLTFVAPLAPAWVVFIIALTVLCEIAGIAGPMLGGSRRLDGPFGEADRSLALGAIGAWLACFGSLPSNAGLLLPTFAILLLVTIANRLRFAAAEANYLWRTPRERGNVLK
jgi:CDP-diacylglycerol--glycerol-3-phosphate 3-phosphatidyltransferase